MVIVAQLVRAPDCGSGGRGFETPHSPQLKRTDYQCVFPFINSFGGTKGSAEIV